MAYAEIQGSRKTIKEGKRTVQIELGVSDDGEGAPELGERPTASGGGAANAVTDPRCTQTDADPETLPGLTMHQSVFETLLAR